MSDLDKLMKKLKKEDVKVEDLEKEVKEMEEDLDQEEEKVEEKPKEEKVEEIPKKEVKPMEEKPKEEKVEENPEQIERSVENEVVLLNNSGIFRRELLLILKEHNDLKKIEVQTLLDIKKAVIGEDGKEKK